MLLSYSSMSSLLFFMDHNVWKLVKFDLLLSEPIMDFQATKFIYAESNRKKEQNKDTSLLRGKFELLYKKVISPNKKSRLTYLDILIIFTPVLSLSDKLKIISTGLLVLTKH